MTIATQAKQAIFHQFHSSILRAYDIRGVAGQTLFPQDAEMVGKAFATAVIRATGKKQPEIALAFDGRLSTPELRDRLVAGLISTGASVRNFGIGPTPMMYFSVHHTGADAGVMITGSHNPPTHNGFKLMLGKNSFYGEDIQGLAALAAAGDFEVGAGKVVVEDITDAYVSVLAGAFKAESAKPLKVAFDPGNGSAGEITRKLIAALGGQHVLINGEIDGNFPSHHPDPTVPTNMQQLIHTVQSQNCDFGIAFDGDGDRIGAVDKIGRILYGDQLMMLFGRDVLSRNPGATIIADVKASQSLFDDIAKHGGKPLMWKTGHSLVKAKMKETGAKLAGEMSGHIFFSDGYFGYDDGIFSGVRLMNLVAHASETLEQMMDAMPKVFNTPEIRIDTTEEKKFTAVEEIRQRLIASGAQMSEVDGVRVKTAEGWWLARASNTQPAIIVRAEASSAEGLERLTMQLKAQIEASGIAFVEGGGH
jgi:phosphomannomutase